MNVSARRDWLTAVSRCVPRLKLRRLRRELERIDESVDGRWEAGLCAGAPFKRLAFRVFGKNQEEPLYALSWDARTDKPERIERHCWTRRPGRPAEKALWSSRPFSAAVFGDQALSRAFSEFTRLAPVRDMRTESVRAGGETRQVSWSLRLKDPLPWPHFLRLDLAAPFGAESCRLSFLTLDRRISELVFRGGELWAYFQ